MSSSSHNISKLFHYHYRWRSVGRATTTTIARREAALNNNNQRVLLRDERQTAGGRAAPQAAQNGHDERHGKWHGERASRFTPRQAAAQISRSKANRLTYFAYFSTYCVLKKAPQAVLERPRRTSRQVGRRASRFTPRQAQKALILIWREAPRKIRPI